MNEIKIIDLNFLKVKASVASFLVSGNNFNALIESGPMSTFDVLMDAIGDQRITHVFLTHIHLDHAGAAWKFAELGAKIYVHPEGKTHLMDPEKLYNSAKRLYGEKMDELWGSIKPIPEHQIIPCQHEIPIFLDETICFTPLFTPGHAVHHISWQYKEYIFTGDVGGVKLSEKGPVFPPCPPPDIHFQNWLESIDLIIKKQPELLYLTHFGIIKDPKYHLETLKSELILWFKRVQNEQNEFEFKKFIQSRYSDYNLNQDEILKYETANPSELSYAGIKRFFLKFVDGDIPFDKIK
jgi:glyoxylase-like metal-dependent hydrolase (beta-lactamase superfamily II)